MLQELLDKAKNLISKGTKMLENNEQSKDQIKLKCNEISELCNKFEKAVQKREEDLKKAMDIHECLEMVKSFYIQIIVKKKVICIVILKTETLQHKSHYIKNETNYHNFRYPCLFVFSEKCYL